MKRLLCVLLITACVLTLGSCELLEKFISFDPGSQSTTTTPNEDMTENKKPIDDKTDATTPENDHEQTTPDDPNKDENNDGISDDQQPSDKPSVNNPDDPNAGENNPDGQVITVEVKFQSGGVHGYQEKITVATPTTFTHVLGLFAQMHEDISFYRLNFYLNGVLVDANDTTFLKDGDYIYLEESGDASGDVYPCSHNWVDGSCMQCGMACPHNEWDDNRQCLACGSWIGVDLLQIEIYENGEPKHSAPGSIETTVQDLLMAYYGYYSWDYWTSTYEFYFNGVLITDGSYMITESGILNLVTRTYE